MRHSSLRSLVPSLAALSLTAFASVAGCSGDSTSASTTGAAPKPTETAFAAGKFTVEPGKELVMCTYVQGDNTAEQDVVKFETAQSEGGHHLIVYTMDHAVDLPPTLCSQGGQPSWSQLLASQIPTETIDFPAGVGFHVKAHQQYVMETHYINTTSKALTVESSFKAVYADPGEVTQRAATYFFGTTNIDVPANGAFTKTVTCSPPAAMSLKTMFGHQHRRGVGVTVDLLSGKDSAPERLYETKQWDGPPITKFDGGKTLGTTDSIQVKCDWQNDTPTRLGYPHEMCFAIGYYWPAEATLFCTSGGGSDQCDCRLQGQLDAGPGGSTVEVKLSYQDGIPGVKGDLTDGSPVYCALFRAQDWDGLLPKAGTQPYYFRDQVDVPLKTSSDSMTFTITDVTPGDYVATCFMDTIHGGFSPGTGDVVNSVTPKVTAVAGKTAHTKAQLDFAIP
ncbi:MAG: hypothetical protein ABJE95_04465 [Byssovorax sp.]